MFKKLFALIDPNAKPVVPPTPRKTFLDHMAEFEQRYPNTHAALKKNTI